MADKDSTGHNYFTRSKPTTVSNSKTFYKKKTVYPIKNPRVQYSKHTCDLRTSNVEGPDQQTLKMLINSYVSHCASMDKTESLLHNNILRSKTNSRYKTLEKNDDGSNIKITISNLDYIVDLDSDDDSESNR